MGVRYLSVDQVLDAFRELVEVARTVPGMPRVAPATCNHAALAGVLGQAAQTWDGEELYPDLFLKAAVYARGIIQGHVFGNGNKRMGLTAAFLFLELNGWRVEMPAGEAVQLALDIANRRTELGDIARRLEQWAMRSA